MNSMQAFAMGQATRDRPLKLFDWDRAAQILVERKPKSASAGLESDLEWTEGVIWEDGKPRLDHEAYLSSTWATPLLIIDGEEIDCYRMESELPDWSREWPASAIAIVNGGDSESLPKV